MRHLKNPRIDVSIVLTMLQEGKTQREIARHLNKSEAAISKTVKRLNAKALLDGLGLTDKELNSVEKVVYEGKSKTQAVMECFEVTSRNSGKALAHTLFQKPKIQKALNTLMEEKGLGREVRVDKLKQHFENPDPIVSLKSLDMAHEWSGDKAAAKEQGISEVSNFTEIGKYTLAQYMDWHFQKRPNKQGWERCAICNESKVEDEEEFCDECKTHCPEIIERVNRYWNGDQCAVCKDDRRCFTFCL